MTTDTDLLLKHMFILDSLYFYVAMDFMRVFFPPLSTSTSLVKQLQSTGVAVIAADLAVRLVEAG